MIASSNTPSKYTFLWPFIAPIQAVRRLIKVGGTDLAASLAFFTVLSQLPLVALMAMLLIAIGPADGVVDVLTEALSYLFPASQDLISEAIDNLLGGLIHHRDTGRHKPDDRSKPTLRRHQPRRKPSLRDTEH